MTETTIPSSSESQPENSLVRQVKEDLAERLDIDLGAIELFEFDSVVWPDSSMGCPQPGMAYTQVPVDGAVIRLAAGDRTYAYHTGGSRSPFLCEQILAPPNPTKTQLVPPASQCTAGGTKRNIQCPSRAVGTT